MIYTTYFANIKKCNGIFYAVSGYVPQFYQKLIDENNYKYKRYIGFAPKKDWWFQWKKGQLNNEKFIQLYYETVLNKLNIKDIEKQFSNHLQDVFLVCYEKPNDFCHRHLISQWLNRNNIACIEYIQPQQDSLF